MGLYFNPPGDAILQSRVKIKPSSSGSFNTGLPAGDPSADACLCDMIAKLKIRCSKCGKVLLARPSEKRKIGKCPKCAAKFAIPSLSQIAERKKTRVVVGGMEGLLSRLPEKLTTKTEKPLAHIVYTEAPPIQFTMMRKNQSPILDLSEGGMSIYISNDGQTADLKLGSSFWVEIDFPVFVAPIYTEVTVRWTKLIEKTNLLQLGLQFSKPDETLQQIMGILMDFVLSRPEAWESV